MGVCVFLYTISISLEVYFPPSLSYPISYVFHISYIYISIYIILGISGVGASPRVRIFLRACAASSELHFRPFLEQLGLTRRILLAEDGQHQGKTLTNENQEGKKDDDKHNSDNNNEEAIRKQEAKLLSLGDVVITLHSNLKDAQAVYHIASVPYFNPDNDLGSASASRYAFSSSPSTTHNDDSGNGSVLPTSSSSIPAHDQVLAGLRHAVLLADSKRTRSLGVPISLAAHNDVFQQIAQHAVMHLSTQPQSSTTSRGSDRMNMGMTIDDESSSHGSTSIGGKLPNELMVQMEATMRSVKHSLNMLALHVADADRSLQDIRFFIPLSSAAIPGSLAASGRQTPESEQKDYALLKKLAIVQQCVTMFQNVFG